MKTILPTFRRCMPDNSVAGNMERILLRDYAYAKLRAEMLARAIKRLHDMHFRHRCHYFVSPLSTSNHQPKCAVQCLLKPFCLFNKAAVPSDGDGNFRVHRQNSGSA